MKFGIVKFENFDPVQDTDLQQATVTIDARLTNMSMRKWDRAEWSGILKALRSVPLYHSSWRPGRNLGLRSWITPEDGMESNSMLNLQFDPPLLPVKQWDPEDDIVARFHCPVFCQNCRTSFNSAGALIRHSQNGFRPQYRDGDSLNTTMMSSWRSAYLFKDVVEQGA